jgi:hypothetical protein
MNILLQRTFLVDSMTHRASLKMGAENSWHWDNGCGTASSSWVTLTLLLLSTIIFSAVGGAKDLTYRSPDKPRLSSVPHDDINSFVNDIYIHSHNLQSLKPFEFGRYAHLTRLALDDLMDLGDDIDPTAFCGTKLVYLSLTNNKLTRVPRAILAVIGTLKTLDLQYNPELYDLSVLKTLIVTSNVLEKVSLGESQVIQSPGWMLPEKCTRLKSHYKVYMTVSTFGPIDILHSIL